MINTKSLSKQLSDLNVALGLFRKQIENVVAVNSDKNQIISQVSSAIREYASMYTGLQMLHSSASSVNDMTDLARQTIASTPFIELRDTLVRMYNRIETSSIKIPLIGNQQHQALSIRDGQVLNAQLNITSSSARVRIVNSNTYFNDSLGSVDIYHKDKSTPDDYYDDFRLVGHKTRKFGIRFKVYTFQVPDEDRQPIRLYHTAGVPVETYMPWSFSLAFSWGSNTQIVFGAEVVFKKKDSNDCLSVSKWGNQTALGDSPFSYIIVEDNMMMDSQYGKNTYVVGQNSYFGSPIPEAGSDDYSNSVLFSDAPLVAVTKPSLSKLIKAVEDLIR